MRDISQDSLFSLGLPIAPIEHRRRFAELAAQICSIRIQQETALARASATFEALLARVFGSEVNSGRHHGKNSSAA